MILFDRFYHFFTVFWLFLKEKFKTAENKRDSDC